MSGDRFAQEWAGPDARGDAPTGGWRSLALSVAVALALAVAAALALGGWPRQPGAVAGGPRGCGAASACCLSGEPGGRAR